MENNVKTKNVRFVVAGVYHNQTAKGTPYVTIKTDSGKYINDWSNKNWLQGQPFIGLIDVKEWNGKLTYSIHTEKKPYNNEKIQALENRIAQLEKVVEELKPSVKKDVEQMTAPALKQIASQEVPIADDFKESDITDTEDIEIWDKF